MTASSSRVSVAAVVPVQSYPMTLFSGRTLVGHVDRSIQTRFACKLPLYCSVFQDPVRQAGWRGCDCWMARCL